MKKLIFVFSMVVIILAINSNVSGQDWPQFRGAERNGKVSGFKMPRNWPSELKQVWKVNVGTADATPVLTGKKLYLAVRQNADEVIICLDTESGKEIWRSTYPSPAVTGPAASHPGPRSTPAVADGKIVTLGVTAILSCLDAATGKLLWRKENKENLIPQFYTAMSPLITDGKCIVHLGTKDKGEVLALDLATGNEKWKWEGDGPSYSSPSVMVIDNQKLLIIHTEKNLTALSIVDGKVLWQVPTPVQQRYYNCTSPYINGQVIYYTGQGTGTKAIQVLKEANNYVTKELWVNPEVGAKWNTPVLTGGFLYGFSDQKRMYCIEGATGKTAWVDPNVTSDFATIVDCGEVIIGLPSTGNLVVLKPDPVKYTEIAKYKVSDTPIYAFPVVEGSYIYIKDSESIIKYSLE